MSEGSTRRDVLMGAAAAGASLLTTALAAGSQPAGKPRPTTPADSTKLLGRVPSELGERSPFVEPRRRIGRNLPSGDSETPLQDLVGIVTPADFHYERHHAR